MTNHEIRDTVRQMLTDWDSALGPRLAKAASGRLRCPVYFVRFDRDPRTGADLPLFHVPDDMRDHATAMGLRVE